MQKSHRNAEDILLQAHWDTQERLGDINSTLRMSFIGLPHAEQSEAESVAALINSLNQYLQDGNTDDGGTDPDELSRRIVAQQRSAADRIIESAAVVFAHSALDEFFKSFIRAEACLNAAGVIEAVNRCVSKKFKIESIEELKPVLEMIAFRDRFKICGRLMGPGRSSWATGNSLKHFDRIHSRRKSIIHLSGPNSEAHFVNKDVDYCRGLVAAMFTSFLQKHALANITLGPPTRRPPIVERD